MRTLLVFARVVVDEEDGAELVRVAIVYLYFQRQAEKASRREAVSPPQAAKQVMQLANGKTPFVTRQVGPYQAGGRRLR